MLYLFFLFFEKVQTHGDPSFVCNICKKKLETRAILNKHKYVHIEEIRFKRDIHMWYWVQEFYSHENSPLGPHRPTTLCFEEAFGRSFI